MNTLVMKFVIPLRDNNGLESTLSDHFGRSPYYAVVEVIDDKIESVDVVENPREQGLRPGEYCLKVNARYVIIKSDGGIGVKALSLFRENGVEVLRVDASTLKEAVQKFLRKEYEYFEGEGCRGVHQPSEPFYG